MLKNIFKKENKNSSLKIIHSQTIDGVFSIIMEDGTEEKFFVFGNKAGARWMQLFGDLEDYKALESLILDDLPNSIVERNKIKYKRNKCEFYLHYLDYVDPWIDPNWDGKLYIEFGFVEKDHPNFETYAAEGLRLQLVLNERWRNKRRE